MIPGFLGKKWGPQKMSLNRSSCTIGGGFFVCLFVCFVVGKKAHIVLSSYSTVNMFDEMAMLKCNLLRSFSSKLCFWKAKKKYCTKGLKTEADSSL